MRETGPGGFSSRVTAALRRRGALVYPIVAGLHAPAGWPDRVVWHPRWKGFVEVKVDAVVAPAQRHVMSELNRRGAGSAFVVRHVDVGSYILEHWTGIADSDVSVRLHADRPLRELLDAIVEFTEDMKL